MARPVKILVYQDTRVLQNKSFNYRAWAGLSVIKDVLARAGVEVGACDAHGASGTIVLATVPSAPSWYSLINAWTRGKPTGATLIVGGSGVLNVRPFLPLPGAVFVLGRGEDLILDLIQAEQAGERLEHESVIYPDSFSLDRTYKLAQASCLYPHRVLMENSKPWKEIAVGCRFRCYFCNYSWGRTVHQPDPQYGQQITDLEAVIAGATNLEEYNLRELVQDWRAGRRAGAGRYTNSAIDGQSQRIRSAVKKPVSREDIVDAAALAPANTRLSLMTVVAFPTETPEDRAEALEDLKTGLLRRRNESPWSIEIAPNSFRPMPVTPCALWPTQLKEWSRLLLREWGAGVEGHRYRLWTVPGRPMGIKSAWGVGGASHLLIDLIALRGTEDDYGNIVALSRTARFWAASSDQKRATLERHFDVGALIREYTPETYPVRYLRGHTSNDRVWRLGARALARLRGEDPQALRSAGPQDQSCS